MTHKIYSTSVKIYHKQQFLCEHTTKGTRPGAYSTNEYHLPEESNPVSKWNRTRYLEWARRVGPNVHQVIANLFDQGSEQQYYRRVHAILKIADTYSDQRLDKVCHYALERSTHPNFKLIKQLIESPMTQSDFNTSNQTDRKLFSSGNDSLNCFTKYLISLMS